MAIRFSCTEAFRSSYRCSMAINLGWAQRVRQKMAVPNTGMATKNTLTRLSLIEKAIKVALTSITGARTSMRITSW